MLLLSSGAELLLLRALWLLFLLLDLVTLEDSRRTSSQVVGKGRARWERLVRLPELLFRSNGGLLWHASSEEQGRLLSLLLQLLSLLRGDCMDDESMCRGRTSLLWLRRMMEKEPPMRGGEVIMVVVNRRRSE
jgi:hypothetical protein